MHLDGFNHRKTHQQTRDICKVKKKKNPTWGGYTSRLRWLPGCYENPPKSFIYVCAWSSGGIRTKIIHWIGILAEQIYFKSHCLEVQYVAPATQAGHENINPDFQEGNYLKWPGYHSALSGCESPANSDLIQSLTVLGAAKTREKDPLGCVPPL